MPSRGFAWVADVLFFHNRAAREDSAAIGYTLETTHIIRCDEVVPLCGCRSRYKSSYVSLNIGMVRYTTRDLTGPAQATRRFATGNQCAGTQILT